MVSSNYLTTAGGLVFASGVALGVFVVATWIGASPLVAAVPTLMVIGLALFVAGDDSGDESTPPTADDLENDA